MARVGIVDAGRLDIRQSRQETIAAILGVEELAERTGVNHGLVHDDFGSMEVMVQVLERCTVRLTERQRSVAAARGMRCAIAFLVCGVIATLVSPADAYTPDPIHRELATAAVRTFNQCAATLNDASGTLVYRPIDPSDASEIVDADAAEDTRRLVRRSWNWHFYSPHAWPLWAFGIDRTALRIYGEIASALDGGGPSDQEQSHTAGRAMHFLEDMTVPAHVVPVYHGPLWGDVVDKYEVGGLDARLVELLPARCTALAESARTTPPRALLDRVALDTRRRLASHPCDGAPATWHAFWIAPERDELFGRYADAMFGVETTIDGCPVTRAMFAAFVLDGHVQAVLADVTLLLRVRRAPGA